MERENKDATWEEAEKEIAERMKKPTSEHLAMEVLKNEQMKNSAKNRGLLAGMILLAALTATIAISGAIERAHLVEVNYQNDVDWRTLFESYDFISQDGGGFNNVNGGEQGDVINGATSEIKEGQE